MSKKFKQGDVIKLPKIIVNDILKTFKTVDAIESEIVSLSETKKKMTENMWDMIFNKFSIPEKFNLRIDFESESILITGAKKNV